MSNNIEKNLRWIKGYEFWKKQYISRNNDYIKQAKILDEMKSVFLNTLKAIFSDKSEFEIQSICDLLCANGKDIDGIFTGMDESTVIFCCYCSGNIEAHERFIERKFHYIGEKVESSNIINAIVSNQFDSLIHYYSPMFGERKISDYIDKKLYASEVLKKFKDIKIVHIEVDCGFNMSDILISVFKNIIEIKKEYEINELIDVDEYSCELKICGLKSRIGVAYNAETGSDASRAIGLWLYDFIESNGCSQSEAVRIIQDMPFFGALGKARSEDSTLKRMHRNTKVCIERAEVLKIQ